MLQSMVFDCDPVRQEAAADGVERLTWSAVRIRIGNRTISRIAESSGGRERNQIYVPVFSIAEWLVKNWWALLHEGCPWENVPREVEYAEQLAWVQRHCLRAADSSFLLPAVYLFHDGQHLRAQYFADADGEAPHARGQYLIQGSDPLDRRETERSLADLVHYTLDLAQPSDDDRVAQLRENWWAIQNAEPADRQFCTLAGKLGLDPYDDEAMAEPLVAFLEEAATRPEVRLLHDLLEVASADSITGQWSWVESVETELKIQRGVPRVFGLPITPEPAEWTAPARWGYRLAQFVRDAYCANTTEPLATLQPVIEDALMKKFRVEARNSLPGKGIHAITGPANGAFVTAGPLSERVTALRFLIARSFYFALAPHHGEGQGPRLVTDAFSWDQKASRAFAAELLAPRAALAERAAQAGGEEDIVGMLSRQFVVSPILVARQLENAGMPLWYG